MIFDAMYLFESGSDRLVALETGRESNGAFADLVDPDLGDKTLLAKNVGPEEIAGHDPGRRLSEVVYGEHPGRALEQLGIPVLYLDLETPDQYERDIEVLGIVFGEPHRSAEILSEYRGLVRRITSRTDRLSGDVRPTVLVLQYDPSEGSTVFDVPPASWLQTTMVSFAGRNPGVARGGRQATDGPGSDSSRSLPGTPIRSTSSPTPGMQRPSWLNSRPMQRGRTSALVGGGTIYGWPGDYNSWDQPDTRWVLGLTWLFTKVQPDLSSDIDVMGEIDRYFRSLYRLTAAEVESAVVPVLTGSLP